ncbi:glucan endo-1,3-beta-glucosidase-like [Impatiens glandulifera]|uniref:glucan endo-1,3-beta-glucosidase-like n=1 Tax=Impatiens glandulifera TaxID=253017 RepID=UPI001FB1604E|nr:glucan endo-1,3-beta-glucosidase-like [Impatiens glandulifera]
MALLLVVLMLALFIAAGAQSNNNIGVCNGGLGNNLPSEQEVVGLYNANGIKKMRIYSPKRETLEALRGSNIELILDAPNVKDLGSDPSFASQWVQANVIAYSSDVYFRYIAVGNEVNPGTEASRFVYPAMQNVYKALVSAGLEDQIKVSTATYSALLGVTYPPSQGSFRNDARSFIDPIIGFLSETNSPLLVNIYPYFSYKGDPQNIPLSYALFTSTGDVVTDGQDLRYDNLFDAMLDSTYAALEKAGGSDLKIIVSESGWPSDGGFGASMDNAGTYYRNLISHVNSGNGTPRRPGNAMQVYLFAMFDENQKTGEESEKHFGLFTPAKQSKYNINSF